MSKYITPISISDFPATLHTNCFGFALGDVESLKGFFQSRKFNLNGAVELGEAFINKLDELGYDEFPRQICTIDDAYPNEYILMILASDKCRVPNFFSEESDLCWDAHIVRRELDGTWVHKPGWQEPPCKICTDADWEAIYEEFGRKYVLFAAAAK